jgi:hypothetical protein
MDRAGEIPANGLELAQRLEAGQPAGNITKRPGRFNFLNDFPQAFLGWALRVAEHLGVFRQPRVSPLYELAFDQPNGGGIPVLQK